VGIGSYASDVHPTRISQGISPHPEQPAPFYIPYRALASKNVRNLLAAGKNMAASYVTNSAYRLHPIEWASGTAAGAAAVLMHTKGLDNAALLFPAALRELQETVATISPIHWPTIDASPIPDSLMDVIVNDLRPIQTGHSFLIEVAHPTAAKACAFLSDGAKVESDKRLNGAFHLKGTINNAGRVQISIKIESNTGAILEERSLEVQVVDQIANAVLLDNFDAGFEFDGEWDLGNVIPDRYGLDYRHINGSGNPDKATAESRWTLDLPTTGQYSVEVWYPADARHASDAPFVVHHRDGATRVAVDQTRQGGRWVPLGVFPMVAGSSVRVSLNNAIVASDRQVVADAVRATLLKETKA
jgi:hypothetical protein